MCRPFTISVPSLGLGPDRLRPETRRMVIRCDLRGIQRDTVINTKGTGNSCRHDPYAIRTLLMNKGVST